MSLYIFMLFIELFLLFLLVTLMVVLENFSRCKDREKKMNKEYF